jgi:hypothetical protein
MSEQRRTGGNRDTPRRGQVFVRSADGTATVVSSRPENFAARLCTTHRITTLDEARNVGLLPGFVNVAVLDREAGRVLAAPSFDRDATRQVDSENKAGARTAYTDERVRQARIVAAAHRLRAADLANAIEPNLAPQARQELAGRALSVLTNAPVKVVQVDIDADLDVYTDLVFASDVTLATFGEVRIYQGARIVTSASHFILRAASAQGGLLRVAGPATPGVSIGVFAGARRNGES